MKINSVFIVTRNFGIVMQDTSRAIFFIAQRSSSSSRLLRPLSRRRMSAAFRTTLRTSSRTALSRGSVARPVVRQSQRFLSASRPEGSNGGPHSGRTINLGSSAIYGIGAGLFFGVWSAFFNDPVKLEAIDFGDQGAEYSRTSIQLPHSKDI